MENNNLENSIKDCIAKELEKGIIEKVISEQLERCIEKSISDLFSYGGGVKKVIEKEIKSVMIPYLESYDYSKYIVKLDSVLTDVLKVATLDNRKLLENFKGLMDSDVMIESIKLSEIFEKWTKYCEDNIDNDKIDMDYEGGYMSTSFDVEEVSQSWSSYTTYMITFICEEDEDLNFQFSIQAWKPEKDSMYTSNYTKTTDLRNIRSLNDFDIVMLSISRGYENIVLDSFGDSTETFIEFEL